MPMLSRDDKASEVFTKRMVMSSFRPDLRLGGGAENLYGAVGYARTSKHVNTIHHVWLRRLFCEKATILFDSSSYRGHSTIRGCLLELNSAATL